MKEKNDTTIHSAVINRAISYIFDHTAYLPTVAPFTESL